MLTRLHYRRLRHYWQGKGLPGGGASLADGIDLDLAAAGLIVRRDVMGGAYFVTTPTGEQELHAEKKREIARRAPHHELARRLAVHLQGKGRITWENIELMVHLAQGNRQLIRPDVYSLVATYNEKNLAPCVHEVKVSRADFLSDVAKAEKRSGYLAVAESVFYVTPEGLVDPAEVPEECGLIVEREAGIFEQVKRTKKRAVRLASSTFMNLVLKPGAVRPLF
jgi:hypothetical protein